MKISYSDISQGDTFFEFKNGVERRLESVSVAKRMGNKYEADFWDSQGNIITIRSDDYGYFDLRKA